MRFLTLLSIKAGRSRKGLKMAYEIKRFSISGDSLMDTTKNDKTERFMYALKVNDTREVERLLVEGINVNAPLGHAHWPPLHQAVVYGHHEMVKVLLQHGADPNLRIRYNRMAKGMVPLDFATNVTIVESLLQAGAKPDCKDKKGMRPVDYAIFRKLDGVIRIFQRHYAQALTA